MPERTDNANLNDISSDLFNIIESAPVGILTFYADGKISFLNKNFLNFGITNKDNFDQLLGASVFDDALFIGFSISSELEAVINGNPFEKIVSRVKSLDGGEISLIVKASPLYENSKFVGGIIIVEDIKLAKENVTSSGLKIEHFKDIFNSFSETLLILDNDGFVKYVYGTKSRQALAKNIVVEGKNISGLVDGKSSNSVIDAFEKIKAGALFHQCMLGLKNNPDNIYSAVFAPLIVNRNKIKSVFLKLTDYTERLSENEKFTGEIEELKLFQDITDSITEPVIMFDGKGNIKFWNKPSSALFGFTRSEVFGRHISKVFNSIDAREFSKIKDELKTGNTWENTINVFKKDGQKEIVEALFSLSVANSDDVLAIFTDITKRTEIEKALKSSEEKYRNIVTFSNELICNLEPDGVITFINPVFSKVFEYSEEEIVGKRLFDFVEENALFSKSITFDAFLDKIGSSFELPVRTKSDKKIYLSANIYPVYSLENNIKYYSAIFTDITEKKEDEKKLLIIKSIFSASQDALYVVCQRKIILANEAFLSIFGYDSIDEVIGKDPLDFIADEEITRVAGFIKARENRRESPGRYECLGKRKDNSSFLGEALITSFEFNNQVYIINEFRDITERKRAQQAIKESEEKYRSIAENIDDFMWTAERIDGKLKSVFYTSSVEKIMGYSQTDFIKDTRLFLKTIHPDDFSYVKTKFKSILHSSIRNSEELEFRIINKQGNVIWIRNKIKIIRNSKKEAQKIFGLVSDISLRKRAEDDLKKSTQELVKLNETKDRFISIISHDLRTPFTSILGFTDLLLSDKDLNAGEKNQYIHFIQESAQSMFALVNSLLDWTRLQTGRIKFEPEKIDAKKIIEKSFRSLAGVAMQKGVQLINTIEDEVLIFADENLILQVINNLISNAVKFTGSGGSITVSVVPYVLNRRYEFSIKDTGTGIKKENFSKLFSVDTKLLPKALPAKKEADWGFRL